MRMVLASVVAGGLVVGLFGSARADEAAKAVIEKALKATGDLDPLIKAKSQYMKAEGKFHGLGVPTDYTGEWSIQGQERLHMQLDMELMGQRFIQTVVFDKDKGWIHISINDMTIDMTEEQVEEFKTTGYVSEVETLAVFARNDPGYKVSLVGDKTIDGKPAIGVRVTKEGQKDVNLYFDKETYLLLKSETRAKDFMTAQTEVLAESFYRDYRDVDGTMTPGYFEIRQDGKVFLDGKVIEAKLMEENLDDFLFEKP